MEHIGSFCKVKTCPSCKIWIPWAHFLFQIWHKHFLPLLSRFVFFKFRLVYRRHCIEWLLILFYRVLEGWGMHSLTQVQISFLLLLFHNISKIRPFSIISQWQILMAKFRLAMLKWRFVVWLIDFELPLQKCVYVCVLYQARLWPNQKRHCKNTVNLFTQLHIDPGQAGRLLFIYFY